MCMATISDYIINRPENSTDKNKIIFQFRRIILGYTLTYNESCVIIPAERGNQNETGVGTEFGSACD